MAPVGITTADVTGDGKLDLVYVNPVAAGQVVIRAGNGDGSFGAETARAVGNTPNKVIVADFNGDTIADLAVANYDVTNNSTGSVDIFLGTGGGNFAAKTNVGSVGRAYDLTAGDFDRDGDLDLAVLRRDFSQIQILVNNGSGAFTTGQLLTSSGTPSTVSIAQGDFNGDGDLDLVAANQNAGNLVIHLGGAGATFGTATTIANVGASNPRGVTAADLNGDGNLDIVYANITNSSGNVSGAGVSVMLGNGAGGFAAPVTYLTGTGASPVTVSVADMNGDGRPDLVVPNFGASPGTASILIGNGNGTFQSHTTLLAGTNPEVAAIGDFDGDGDNDIAVNNSGSTSISIFLNNTNGRGDIDTKAITVTEVNDAPTAVDNSLSAVAEDSGQRTISFASLLGNDSKGPSDESGQALTITAVNNAVGGSVSISGTDVLFTPNANFNGVASFDYTVSDNGTTSGSGDPQTDLGSVSFAVTEVADTPLVTNATTSEDTQSTAGLVISRNVADSAAVTHFKITAITGGTLFQNDGTTAIGNGSFITFAQANAGLKFTPASNVNSPAGDAFSFGVQASISAGDAGLNGAVATANVTVTEVNDAPTAVDDSLSAVAEDSGQRTISFASLLGNDSKGPSDESGQALTITAVNNAVGGSVSISGTDVLFTPNANFNGVASFDYTVSDNGTTSGSGDPQTDLGSVSFAVTEVADTPLVTNATTSEDTQSTAGLVISRNVADSAAVTHFKITAITGGTLFQNDGTTAIGNGSFITFAQANAGLKFTPASNVNSPAGDAFSFGVQASISAGDAGLNGAVATANVTVTEVNDAPTAADDSLSAVAEDSGQRTISFASLLGNDSKGPSNESGQTLTITAVNNAVGGSVSISGTDVLFTPNAELQRRCVVRLHGERQRHHQRVTATLKTDTGTASRSRSPR